MSALISSKIHPRAVMQLQKEFSKPFASKALAEFRKDPPKTFSAVASTAKLSNTASDQQATNSQPRLVLSDMNGSNVPAFAASNKLMLEESLRKSTQCLNVGNLLIEKAHKATSVLSMVLYEDL